MNQVWYLELNIVLWSVLYNKYRCRSFRKNADGIYVKKYCWIGWLLFWEVCWGKSIQIASWYKKGGRDEHHARTAQGSTMAEQNQPQPNQDQQTLFQQQPHQFQQAMWQPHASQWPSQPVGPQPSVWGSQDRSYIQRQFPTVSVTSPIPPVINPQHGISGSKASTITATATALPSTVSESFYCLSGQGPQNVGNVNPSPQLNPETLAVDDETVAYQAQAHPDDQ